MSESSAPVGRDSAWRIYAVVVGVGVACGTLILIVRDSTSRRIADNRLAFRDRAALAVLPGAERTVALAAGPDGRLRPADRATPDGEILAGYDTQGVLVGVAIEATGRGYQDTIRLIYGYSPSRRAILGFRILESRETPGLGDRVETDDAFRDQFDGLPVRAADDGDGLRQEIHFAGPGASPESHQIAGISGATVTSRAVTAAIADSARRWVPRIESDYQAWDRYRP